MHQLLFLDIRHPHTSTEKNCSTSHFAVPDGEIGRNLGRKTNGIRWSSEKQEKTNLSLLEERGKENGGLRNVAGYILRKLLRTYKNHKECMATLQLFIKSNEDEVDANEWFVLATSHGGLVGVYKRFYKLLELVHEQYISYFKSTGQNAKKSNFKYAICSTNSIVSMWECLCRTGGTLSVEKRRVLLCSIASYIFDVSSRAKALNLTQTYRINFNKIKETKGQRNSLAALSTNPLTTCTVLM